MYDLDMKGYCARIRRRKVLSASRVVVVSHYQPTLGGLLGVVVVSHYQPTLGGLLGVVVVSHYQPTLGRQLGVVPWYHIISPHWQTTQCCSVDTTAFVLFRILGLSYYDGRFSLIPILANVTSRVCQQREFGFKPFRALRVFYQPLG